MTTIAYDGKELACDSCWASGDTQVTSRNKLLRLSSGAIIGTAGDCDDREIIALLDKVKTLAKLPTREQLAKTRLDFACILVLPGNRVFYIEIEASDDGKNHYDAQLWETRGLAACGTGRDLALGAMGAGSSAREAVVIACRFDINSRPPVHSLKLARTKA